MLGRYLESCSSRPRSKSGLRPKEDHPIDCVEHEHEHEVPAVTTKRNERETTHVINSAFIIAVASWSLLLRSRRNEPISSMKMILGCVFRARLNSPATSLFDSPNHLFVNTDAVMLMKVAPDSFARALASIVLPHPGGP